MGQINQTSDQTPSRIAILDDDTAMVSAVSDVLTAFGFSVNAFSSARDLIADMHPGHYQAFILDWNLEGSTCLPLISSLRTTPSYENVPVFILSGDAKAAHGSPCEVLSAAYRLNVKFLQKPYSTKKLAALLSEAIRCQS